MKSVGSIDSAFWNSEMKESGFGNNPRLPMRELICHVFNLQREKYRPYFNSDKKFRENWEKLRENCSAHGYEGAMNLQWVADH